MIKKLVAAFALSAVALATQAGALDSLENFVRNAKTGRSDFTQVITGPVREGQAARTRTSSGSFEFQRPNRFRFEYRKPFEQSIVADGETCTWRSLAQCSKMCLKSPLAKVSWPNTTCGCLFSTLSRR